MHAKPNENAKPKTKYPIVTAEVSIFLFSLAYHVHYATFKNLLLTKICLERFDNNLVFCLNTSNPVIGKDDYIQENVSFWDLFSNAFYYVTVCFTATFIGSWSDKFGRKFPLFIPPFGLAIFLIFLGIYDLNIKEMPIWTVSIANLFHGLGGGEFVMRSLVISYVISITDFEHRISRISIIEAMLTTAAMAGPLIALVLKKEFGNFSVFFTAAGICILSILYSLIFLKKVDPEQPQVISLKNLFSVAHIKEGLYICFRSRKESRRKYIFLMFAVIIVYYFTSNGSATLLYVFVKDAPISWSFQDLSILLSSTSAAGGFIMLIVFPVFIKFVHVEDTTIAVLSAIANVFFCSIQGLATNTALVYIASYFFVLAWFHSISCRTIVSKLVNSDEEGKIFSIMALVENMGYFLSSVLYNALWPITRTIFKGLLFEVSAAMAAICVFVLLYMHFKLKNLFGKRSGYQSIPSHE